MRVVSEAGACVLCGTMLALDLLHILEWLLVFVGQACLAGSLRMCWQRPGILHSNAVTNTVQGHLCLVGKGFFTGALGSNILRLFLSQCPVVARKVVQSLRGKGRSPGSQSSRG